MVDRQDSSWTRALMASSGIAFGHNDTPRRASAEQAEASASDTPMARLQGLASSRDVAVRAIIARRPDCPIGLLASLAYDSQSEVRAGVAGNPRITEAVADHLARDRDASVVKVLARNHAVALRTLEGLSLHRKEDVRRVAGRNLDARVHPRDGASLSDEATAEFTAAAKPSVTYLPAELVDKVTPSALWLHEVQERDIRRSDVGRIRPA